MRGAANLGRVRAITAYLDAGDDFEQATADGLRLDQDASDEANLQRAIPGAGATVLSRNNSANRLEATTESPIELAAILR